MPSNRLYIGKLNDNIKKFDIIQAFYIYGESKTSINDKWILICTIK